MLGKTFLHYLGVALGISRPVTQTSHTERQLLTNYLPGKKTIVEVGVFEGFTTRELADASDSDATVYGVDPFFTGRLGACWGLAIAKAYNRDHISRGKVKLIRGLSTEVGDRVPKIVDYVFIDGDHSWNGICADWAFWTNRVARGGIIVLHDVLPIKGQSQFGSHDFFLRHISKDRQFQVLDTGESLAVLERT
jgi:predicted O-methyltransferase YrrM